VRRPFSSHQFSSQLGGVIRTPVVGGRTLTTVTTLVHALQSEFLLSPLVRLFRRRRSFWGALHERKCHTPSPDDRLSPEGMCAAQKLDHQFALSKSSGNRGSSSCDRLFVGSPVLMCQRAVLSENGRTPSPLAGHGIVFEMGTSPSPSLHAVTGRMVANSEPRGNESLELCD
jgi:hypothetical protein